MVRRTLVVAKVPVHMTICIGSINVDFIFAAARWPAEHEKYRAENYVCANGGSAANTAVELSRLGRKVTIVGGIGTDDLGNIARRSLIKAGIKSITLSDEAIGRRDVPPFVQWEKARAY
jgi:sugar/nucleoside kinase (ribokinase family)